MYKLTTNDIEGEAPEIIQSLDELAREGARRMILAALELEVEQYNPGDIVKCCGLELYWRRIPIGQG